MLTQFTLDIKMLLISLSYPDYILTWLHYTWYEQVYQCPHWGKIPQSSLYAFLLGREMIKNNILEGDGSRWSCVPGSLFDLIFTPSMSVLNNVATAYCVCWPINDFYLLCLTLGCIYTNGLLHVGVIITLTASQGISVYEFACSPCV